MSTYHKTLIFYATAPRAYIGTIGQLDTSEWTIRTYYVGKLRGKIVSRPGDNEYKFASKDEARNCARLFRESCRKEATALGLMF